ncbi:MAG: hypothetical protein EPO24_03235 [Bacteroidetes bacterium]|nr:MAG: hypothetical protein EPO24_03235 [Bacteroidota bacterium]
MTFVELRDLFEEEYAGEIRDPVLDSILHAVHAYQDDIQNRLLLSVYARHTTGISDAFFEILCRHLFGQMFPGPAYIVLHGMLRDGTGPIKLEQGMYFDVQGRAPNGDERQVSFAPMQSTWLIPSYKDNDIAVEPSGNDLLLGFPLQTKHLGGSQETAISVFIDSDNLFLIERLRCRLYELGSRIDEEKKDVNPLLDEQPTRLRIAKDFFVTPFEARTLRIPVHLFRNAISGKGGNEVIQLRFQGLGDFAPELDQKIKMNSFLAWNMVEHEDWIFGNKESTGGSFRFSIRNGSLKTHTTIVKSVVNEEGGEQRRYLDASSALDPLFPFQYTSTVDSDNDAILLSLSPVPHGEVKLSYFMYDTSPVATGIPQGKPFTMGQGIEKGIRTIQSLSEAQRVNVSTNKEAVWEYFRSMIASRGRWLTKDDLRGGIAAYPPFASLRSAINFDDIRFRESVGRIPYRDSNNQLQFGFLTPYTDIEIPVREQALLNNPDKDYFRKRLTGYLKQRTIQGNFLQVKFIPEEDK